jgi:hypothetical protein
MIPGLPEKQNVVEIAFEIALLPPLAYLFCAMVEGNLATPIFLGRWLTRVGLLSLELNC